MSGCVRIPALVDEVCPKCGASSDPGVGRVWRVADANGLHYECDVCAHAWTMWRQGRATCAVCGRTRQYVAEASVKELVCQCGGACELACEE